MLAEGQTIGPYRIVDQLGQGGMATVYRAYHAKLDRYVAIKMMHKAFLEDKDFLARFEREARIVARLEHPNIVPVYDYSEYEGVPFLVMKHIQGQTLKARLFKGSLPLDEIRRIMGKVADALDYAHAQGVLHRDIKPSNIVMDPDGTPYLTDFGLARIAQSGPTTMSADMMLGTPHYISPEQASGASDLDHRADLYSLGIVLYELVVGQVPFNADTPYAIVHDHIYSDVPLPTAVNPDIPVEVEAVLLKALAKSPADRYNSAREMMDAFDQAVERAGLRELDPDRASSAAISLSQLRKHVIGSSGEESTAPQNVESPLRDRTGSSGKRRLKVERTYDVSDFSGFENLGPKVEDAIRRGTRWMEDMASRIEEKVAESQQPPTEEEIIRRRVEKRMKAWRGFKTHLFWFLAMNLVFWFMWAGTGPVISSLPLPGDVAQTVTNVNNVVPWPLFITIFWGLGLLGHWSSYQNKYGRGARRLDDAVRKEIERERGRRERYGNIRERRARRKDKRKHIEIPTYDEEEAADSVPSAGKRVRLNDEGELTDSFIQDRDDYEGRQYH